MCLVWIGCAVWDVLAIEDGSGGSVVAKLEGADPSDGGAIQMRARLETEVPLNGPPFKNRRKCVDLGHEIYELKEWNWRVLWFYDAGAPKARKRIICTHSSNKTSKKEFQPEVLRARRLRDQYLEAKATGQLSEPERPKERP
jgi:hypothetical protein